MTKPTSAFDLLVDRIATLLRAEGCAVTWLDDTLDPDDPSEPRAIDMTLTRDNRLTLVELRDHRLTDHAGWFGALSRKRHNVKADAAIAVVAGEVSQTDRETADRLGIILRPLVGLSDPEVRRWGRTVTVRLTHVEYRTLRLQCIVPERHADAISEPPAIGSSIGMDNPTGELIAYLRQEFAERISPKWTRWKADIADHNLTLDGVPVLNLAVIFEARFVTDTHRIQSAVAYPAGPGGGTEGAMHVIADVSQISQSDNRLFHRAEIDLGDGTPVAGHKLVGADGLGLSNFDVITLDVITVPE